MAERARRPRETTKECWPGPTSLCSGAGRDRAQAELGETFPSRPWTWVRFPPPPLLRFSRSALVRIGTPATASPTRRRTVSGSTGGCRHRRARGTSFDQWRCPWPTPGQPAERMVLGYFIVSDDVERSGAFIPRYSAARWSSAQSRRTSHSPTPSSSSNGGGGPTDYKPAVTLEHAMLDPDRVNRLPRHLGRRHPRGIRPMERPRCAVPDTTEAAPVRDPAATSENPDGYIIEVGQTTDPHGDWWPADWPLDQSWAGTRLTSSPATCLKQRRKNA